MEFQRPKGFSEGGNIGGNLTWISKNSKNTLGANNETYSTISSLFLDSESTKFKFIDKSILAKTQDILDTLPTDDGTPSSHVANVIDQTSRVFREGDILISKGSAIIYAEKFKESSSQTGKTEVGVEYCRVWTKDRPYIKNHDLQKKTGLIRNNVENSVLTTPYNINIYPNSKGEYNSYDNSSSNIKPIGKNEFFAKKYMFSIENLAWKTSNIPGYTFAELPFCERGNNGGRVMWFPPYGLKVNEQNAASWEPNEFLGRPEPIYTYKNTNRSANISFKVVVDHPSILNLLARDYFDGMSDEEADNYINSFFAGCNTIDFYDLVRSYATLTPDEVKKIMQYLNEGTDENLMKNNIGIITPNQERNPATETQSEINAINATTINGTLYFNDSIPQGSTDPSQLYTQDDYESTYNSFMATETAYIDELEAGLNELLTTPASNWGINQKSDKVIIFGTSDAYPTIEEQTNLPENQKTIINKAFDDLVITYANIKNELATLKTLLEKKKIKEIELDISSSASFLGEKADNIKLSYRRSHSVILDILNKIKAEGATPEIKWTKTETSSDPINEYPNPISFKDLGYQYDGNLVFKLISNKGEDFITPYDNKKCGELEIKTLNLQKKVSSSFFCRQSTICLEYTLNDDNQVITDTETEAELAVKKQNQATEDPTQYTNYRTPLNEMKRIVMNVLSEDYYFKKLEKESPIVFTSLRDKLRYFHPAFHSTTPEGLNARLTFLLQCLRPGDTIPIKGIADANDLNARNTSFGPPPICILRIGDFYHTKMVIRDVNITYEDNVWDLNPEGIGIQPMIADVTLNVNFIGGHGLERPVAMLQNALTSNFYANTEVYDYKSIETERYSKEFIGKHGFLEDKRKIMLAEIQDREELETKPQVNLNSNTESINGEYIGIYTPSSGGLGILSYTEIIEYLYDFIEYYYNIYILAIKRTTQLYGNKLASVYFDTTYRTIYTYTVQTNSSPITINLFGEYPNIFKNLSALCINFENVMINKLETIDINKVMGFDHVLSSGQLDISTQILKPFIKLTIKNKIDEIISERCIDDLELNRNDLINTLDKLNFIIETNHDGKLDSTGNTITAAELDGYTDDNFYSEYNNIIEYIQSNDDKLTKDLDMSFNFWGNTVSDDDFEEFLKVLLYDEERKIKRDLLALYESRRSFYEPPAGNPKIISNLAKKIDEFVEKPDMIEPQVNKYPIRKSENLIAYNILNIDYIFDATEESNLRKIMQSSGVPLGDTLNYYKP
jgi:hypothetical protein